MREKIKVCVWLIALTVIVMLFGLLLNATNLYGVEVLGKAGTYAVVKTYPQRLDLPDDTPDCKLEVIVLGIQKNLYDEEKVFLTLGKNTDRTLTTEEEKVINDAVDVPFFSDEDWKDRYFNSNDWKNLKSDTTVYVIQVDSTKTVPSIGQAAYANFFSNGCVLIEYTEINQEKRTRYENAVGEPQCGFRYVQSTYTEEFDVEVPYFAFLQDYFSISR